MKGNFDATCINCGKRFGWFGELKDKPPCPKCGHKNILPESEQKRLDDLEKKLEEEMLK